MKIDVHQHFWKYSKEEYPWISEGMEILAQDRLPADLKSVIQDNGIDGTISVQARQNLEETEALLKMAEENDFILGVVGWVDLRDPNVEEQLEKFTHHPKMVGVRHVVQDEPDDRFVLREDFILGIKKLKEFNLIYDILIFPNQLPASVELVGKFPEQAFVLNHIAKPYIKDRKIAPWDRYIKAMGSHSNVACKISGMVTEHDWKSWEPEDFTPYMEVVLEAFGSERLMIGSDWPVCTLAAEYHQVISIAANFISKLSEAEQQAVWEKNPVKVYRLK